MDLTPPGPGMVPYAPVPGGGPGEAGGAAGPLGGAYGYAGSSPMPYNGVFRGTGFGAPFGSYSMVHQALHDAAALYNA